MCQNEAINGVTRDGGYAEYVLLRTEAVVRVPKEVDPVEYAPILCAGITVFNSIRKQKITPGDTVAIQGLGGLGHLAVQYANKMGYKVVALSSNDKKKDFAKKLGAHEYIDSSKDDPAKKLMEVSKRRPYPHYMSRNLSFVNQDRALQRNPRYSDFLYC